MLLKAYPDFHLVGEQFVRICLMCWFVHVSRAAADQILLLKPDMGSLKNSLEGKCNMRMTVESEKLAKALKQATQQ